jgi:hypothetical protein
MAKLTYDPGQPAITGRLGNVVYRRRSGRTEMASRPKAPAVGWSAKQTANRDRFSLAAAYAREMLAEPLRARRYTELASARKTSVTGLLIKDYRTPPTIELIEDSAYRGQAGNPIRILATDDLEVVSVQVTLRDRQNAAIESGPAVKAHDIWTYVAQTTLPPNEPVNIEVTALDRPRHEGKGSKIWMPVSGPA